MTALEIILLILGAIIFVASFIVPESKSEMDAVDRELTQEQLKEILKAEMKGMHSEVEDTVEETVSYAMERTERALERMTNEKISAISEYTETVLTDIHKSHEEVLFLYDMLNDKHENIKETATEVNHAVKVASEIVQEADMVKKEVSEATQALEEAQEEVFRPMDVSGIEKLKQQQKEADTEKPKVKKRATSTPKRSAKGKQKPETETVSIQFDVAQETTDNSNERILELHKKGKSNVAIAKELGLGVGEVKLVIDLFKGI